METLKMCTLVVVYINTVTISFKLKAFIGDCELMFFWYSNDPNWLIPWSKRMWHAWLPANIALASLQVSQSTVSAVPITDFLQQLLHLVQLIEVSVILRWSHIFVSLLLHPCKASRGVGSLKISFPVETTCESCATWTWTMRSFANCPYCWGRSVNCDQWVLVC